MVSDINKQYWYIKEYDLTDSNNYMKENNMGNPEVANVLARESQSDQVNNMDSNGDCDCNEVCEACQPVEGAYYDDKVGGVVCVDDCVHEFNLKFEFYERMGIRQRIEHSFRMIKEESKEVVDALKEHAHTGGLVTKAALIKELCDLEYVMSQAILLLELDDYMCEAFKEVHRSNMSKVDDNGEPIFDKKGKLLKGSNYSPADIVSVIKKVDEFYAEVK